MAEDPLASPLRLRRPRIHIPQRSGSAPADDSALAADPVSERNADAAWCSRLGDGHALLGRLALIPRLPLVNSGPDRGEPDTRRPTQVRDRLGPRVRCNARVWNWCSAHPRRRCDGCSAVAQSRLIVPTAPEFVPRVAFRLAVATAARGFLSNSAACGKYALAT